MTSQTRSQKTLWGDQQSRAENTHAVPGKGPCGEAACPQPCEQAWKGPSSPQLSFHLTAALPTS